MTADEIETELNYDCPSECEIALGTEGHDEPEADDMGVWVCPVTNDRYIRCDVCNDWELANGQYGFDSGGGYRRWPVQVSMPYYEWVCSTDTHDIAQCSSCEDYFERDPYTSTTRCDGCYEDNDYDSDYDSSESGESGVTWCYRCHASNDRFDELSEAFLCKCTENVNHPLVRALTTAT